MTGRFSRRPYLTIGVTLTGVVVAMAVDKAVGVIILVAGLVVAGAEAVRTGHERRRAISAVLLASFSLTVVSQAEGLDASFWLGAALILGSAAMLLFDEYLRPRGG